MWFSDAFTNFRTNLTRVAQRAGAFGKIIWSNIPHLLQGAKVIGNVLGNAGIPIGSSIETGADILRGVYDGINNFAGVVNKEQQLYSGGGSPDNR